MTLILTLIVVLAVVALAIGLAWIPMRLLLKQMAKNVREFIQRTSERRVAPRRSPDRRKTPEPAIDAAPKP